MTTNSNPHWLTGLFFDVAGSPELTFVSAEAPLGMVTFDENGPSPYTDVGPAHFWAFRSDLTGESPFGQQYGLGATGFDVFGPGDILDPQEGGPTPQPGGVDGGILPNIEDVSVPKGHFGRPYVLGELHFKFDLGEYDIEYAGVENIAFVFGTGFDEIVLIPLPAALPMGLAGLVGVIVIRRVTRSRPGRPSVS